MNPGENVMALEATPTSCFLISYSFRGASAIAAICAYAESSIYRLIARHLIIVG
jgi:hypothetical protein